MSETQLSAAIRSALEKSGYLVLRHNSGRVPTRNGWFYGCPPGTPDMQVPIKGGRSVWLETKTPEGKLRPAQVEMHALLRRLGHAVEVPRDVPSAVKAVLLAKHAGGAHG